MNMCVPVSFCSFSGSPVVSPGQTVKVNLHRSTVGPRRTDRVSGSDRSTQIGWNCKELHLRNATVTACGIQTPGRLR